MAERATAKPGMPDYGGINSVGFTDNENSRRIVSGESSDAFSAAYYSYASVSVSTDTKRKLAFGDISIIIVSSLADYFSECRLCTFRTTN